MCSDSKRYVAAAARQRALSVFCQRNAQTVNCEVFILKKIFLNCIDSY